MQKLREDGGIKLINIKSKSEVPKVHWLIRLITESNLKVQLEVAKSLVGLHADLSLPDIIFTDQDYVKKYLKTESLFYKDALTAITRLNVWKKVPEIRDARFFYNPIFTSEVGRSRRLSR